MPHQVVLLAGLTLWRNWTFFGGRIHGVAFLVDEDVAHLVLLAFAHGLGRRLGQEGVVDARLHDVAAALLPDQVLLEQ